MHQDIVIYSGSFSEEAGIQESINSLSVDRTCSVPSQDKIRSLSNGKLPASVTSMSTQIVELSQNLGSTKGGPGWVGVDVFQLL